MKITALMNLLESINPLDKPIRVKITTKKLPLLYGGIFFHSTVTDEPALIAIDEECPPGTKKGNVFLEELTTLKRQSKYYDPNHDVYVQTSSDIGDNSYILSFNKIDEVQVYDEYLLFISNSEEDLEMREQYEYPTEDMYDYSDDDDE